MTSAYLELLKRVLTDTLVQPEPVRGSPDFGTHFVNHYFRNPRPLSCLPRKRLDHLVSCIHTLVREQVPGDLIETGVWRGGATILMRATLKELSVSDRVVWVADSFQGLPQPDRERFPREALARASQAMEDLGELAVPLDQVREAFRVFGLLDEQVRFLPGWFQDTLPTAPIERLALLRLDGDFYQSTRDALDHLYQRVSAGGFIIVDDYGEDDWTYCRQAVDEFRSEHNIRAPLQALDDYCCFWRRAADECA